MTINGTISLKFVDYSPNIGDEIRLWTGVKSFSGTPTIECKDNVTFDASRLAEGVLVVKSADANGINSILAEDYETDNIYTIEGKFVGTNLNSLPKGIYIRNNKKITK